MSETPATSRLVVVLEGGDDASGFASMVARLLEDNLRDFPNRARVARWTRGDVALVAADREVAVTLCFRPGTITVADGAKAGAPQLAGGWETMAKLCSGRVSPLRALVGREVKVGRGPGMHVVPAVSFVLTVPTSFYGEGDGRRRAMMVAAGVGVAALGAGGVYLVRVLG